MKKIVVIYEIQQLQALKRFLSEHKGSHTVLACGLDIEFVLEKEGVPYESAQDLRPTPTIERLEWAQKTARAIFDDVSMDFFSHKDVRLGELFVVMVQDYFNKLSYWLDIATALTRGTVEEIVVFSSMQGVPWAANEMASFELRAPLDAFALACERTHVSFVREGEPKATALAPAAPRPLVETALWFLNVLITVLVPPKPLRIIASEKWHNISPLMAELQECELDLLDRGETMHIGWRNILRYRVRLRSLRTRVSAPDFLAQWEAARVKNVPLQNISFKGISVAYLAEEAVSKVMGVGGPRAVSMVEGAFSLMRSPKPQLVLVRASASAQIHFIILCRVARLLKIPSLELQHGTLYLGAGAYASRPAAEYVAEYGPRARAELKTVGYDDAHLFDIGSPRFEAYTQEIRAQPLPQENRIAYIAPEVAPGLWVDSYDCMDYFEGLARAIPSDVPAHVTIKLRAGPSYEAFYYEAIARAFKYIPHDIAQYEPLSKVFGEASVLVSGYSTAIIEGLLSGRPFIHSGILPMHKVIGEFFSYPEYAEKGALMNVDDIPSLSAALRELLVNPTSPSKLVAGADRFMREEYCFNPGASRRLADAIRSLARRAGPIQK